LRKNFREIHSFLCDYFISQKAKFILEGRRFCDMAQEQSLAAVAVFKTRILQMLSPVGQLLE
jgi:hypothetical protein